MSPDHITVNICILQLASGSHINWSSYTRLHGHTWYLSPDVRRLWRRRLCTRHDLVQLPYFPWLLLCIILTWVEIWHEWKFYLSRAQNKYLKLPDHLIEIFTLLQIVTDPHWKCTTNISYQIGLCLAIYWNELGKCPWHTIIMNSNSCLR